MNDVWMSFFVSVGSAPWFSQISPGVRHSQKRTDWPEAPTWARGVRGHLWWVWAFTNEKNILPDAVFNFMFWRVKNETCFHLINKTWCIWFAKTSNRSKVLNFGVSWWEAARPSTMQMEINASGTGNRWRPNERRWKRQSHPRRLMDGKKRPPGRPQGLDGNTESAVTVSKEDPASPQFDSNRQDAKIKNQH